MMQSSFDERYPNARPGEEVFGAVYKMKKSGPCSMCGTNCSFASRTFLKRVCSIECNYKAMEEWIQREINRGS